MVPEHNDERWLMDDQVAEAAATAGAAAGGTQRKGKRGKRQRQQQQQHEMVGDMPLKELLRWAAALVAAEGAFAGGAGSAAGASSSKANAGKGAGGSTLPLQLAPNLVLQCLGRVEFLHPAFHNDKFIYPVGFAVRRRARTPCSDGRVIWHTAEVLQAPDGSGPLFRWGRAAAA
jgi:hypothetical protein